MRKRNLFEVHPGKPNGYLEYQASQVNPTQQLSSSLTGAAFVESFMDDRRRSEEEGTLDTSQPQAAGFLDNRAKTQKKGVLR